MSAPNLCSSFCSSAWKSHLKAVTPKDSLWRTLLQLAGAVLLFQWSRKFHRICNSLAFLLEFLYRWFRQSCCVSLAHQQASMTWQVRCSRWGEASITQITEAVVPSPHHLQKCNTASVPPASHLPLLWTSWLCLHRLCLQASLCHF